MMKPLPFRLVAAGALCLLLLTACLAACVKAKPPAATGPASPRMGSPPTGSPSSTLSGTLTVFAASPLKGAFDKIGAALVAAHPGLRIVPTYQGSQALVTAIQSGATADVFAGADAATMAVLTATGSVVTQSVHSFAKNVLEIVVATGNPRAVETLADLAKPGVVVTLADPGIPVGRDAQQALRQAHVSLHPKSLELQVAGVLTKVQTGDADAGIVFRSDVTAAGPSVTGVAIPAAQNVVTSYAMAPLKDAANPEAARAYIQFILSGEGQTILRSSGFLPPAP